MHLNRENKYLVTYLVALLCLTIALWFINLSFQTLNYILLGFCWSLTIHAPSLRGKLELKRYKFSLIRFIFGIDNFLCSFTNQFYLRIVLRSIPAMFISFLCYLISMEGVFLSSIIGSLYFEIIFQRERILRLIKSGKEDL